MFPRSPRIAAPSLQRSSPALAGKMLNRAGPLGTATRAPTRLHPSSTPVHAAVALSTANGGSAGGGSATPPERRAAATTAAAAARPAYTAPVAAPAAAPAAAVDDFAVDRRPIILYDGVCGLCNRGVNFMLDQDPRGAFRLVALQSPAGRRLLARCGRSPDDLSSIVLVEPGGRHHIRSEAILRIGAALAAPLPLLAALGFPVPLPLRDAMYDAVANNRYSFFGRTDACRLRDAGKFADRFIVD